MLIRRVVPAIVATLAAYAGLALATGLFLRQHYLAPLVTSKLNVPGSAWVISQWWTKGGKFAIASHALAQILQTAPRSRDSWQGRPGRPSPGSASPSTGTRS